MRFWIQHKRKGEKNNEYMIIRTLIENKERAYNITENAENKEYYKRANTIAKEKSKKGRIKWGK
jgi:hypothetical protein